MPPLVKMHESYRLAKLTPYDNNPRINDAAVDATMVSMQKHGLIAPILVDENYRICCGHTRLKAAMKLGHKTFPVVVYRFENEAAFVGYNIADNQTASIAGWDVPLLKQNWDFLQQEGYVPNQAGFAKGELDELFRDLITPGSGAESTIDDVPPVPKKAKSKLGDLYLLGRHRLLCGDATMPDAIERLMDGVKAHMIFTDPPYNVSYTGPKQCPVNKRKPIDNDTLASGDYKAFCVAFAKHFDDVCDGCVYVCHAPGPDGRIVACVLDDIAHPSTTLVWNKNTFVIGGGKYQSKWEAIWFGWTKSGRGFTKDRSLSNVWDFPRPTVSDLHPTMKPVALIEQAVRHASQRGHIVYDPFLGSGSTMIACERLGRACYAIEIDPLYVDVAVKRWEQHTSLKAQRIREGANGKAKAQSRRRKKAS